VLASAIALASCSDSGNSVTVGNSNPLGVVGGVIWDAASEMPLPAMTVTVIAGGKSFTAMSDMNGLFSVANVPSGNFIATVSDTMMKYLSASLNGTLGGAVGNFPVKDPIVTLGPIGLVKNDGTFSVKVVDQFGAPAPNVPLTARPQLQWVSFNNGFPSVMGSYEITAMSGMDGTATFMGLPDYASLGPLFNGVDSLPIDVPPVQVMGSMTVYSFLGATFTFDVTHLGCCSGVIDQSLIQLAGPSTPLKILSSNLDYLLNVQAVAGGSSTSATPNFSGVSTVPYVTTTGAITIEFNQSVNRTTIRAQLLDETGTVTTPPLMAGGKDNVLTITPMAALTAGTRYNMVLHIDAASAPGQQSTGREMDLTAPLFVTPPSGVAVKLASTTPPKWNVDGAGTVTVEFAFSEPVGVGFARTDQVSCVAYYEGISLNNGMNTPLPPGQWPMGSTTGAGTTCTGNFLDITAIQPEESTLAPGMPVTGFSTHWHVVTDRAGHPECLQQASCNFPSPPPLMHLIFNHSQPGFTIKRPDGTPVVGDPSFSFTPAQGP
jgi:hypothetical protein